MTPTGFWFISNIARKILVKLMLLATLALGSEIEEKLNLL